MIKLKIFKCLFAVILLLVMTSCTVVRNNVNDDRIQEDTTPKPTPTSTHIPEMSQQKLIINLTPSQYTYDDLEYDIGELKRICGDLISVHELCTTVDGRKVYDIILGDYSGENQILIFGAMHAREYITSQVVMRQLCECIDAVNGYKTEYKGIRTDELLSGITIHFIPMSNPDGVAISQFGMDGILTDAVKNNIISMGSGDYEQWKANANGVDLNRNFDAGWDDYIGEPQPSSDRYKGEYPGSETESEALINLTKECTFKRTISYHTCGALIYWFYKQSGEVLDKSRRFAQSISDETGYVLDSDYTAVDAAGYKDWAVYKMGIPSITIEIGNENGNGIVNPVPIEYFDSIWERNKNVVYAAVYDLKY